MLGPARIRVGVMPGSALEEPETAARFWRLVDLCEATAVDSLWLSDRLLAPTLEPLAALGAVAGRTRRLKFGTAALVLPFRGPLLTAKAIATLDVLSGGRVFPVVGVGLDLRREWEAAGVPPGTRAARTDEAIAVLRRLFTETEVTHRSDWLALDRVRLEPRPVQAPPPLWLGGTSEAALRRAGRLGDGWLASLVTPTVFGRGVERIVEHAAAAGRAIPADHFGAIVPFALAESPEAGWRAAEPRLPRDRVDEATLRATVAAGPPEAVAARLEQYIARGGTKFVLRPLGPPAAALDEIAVLAEAVVPALHAR